MSIGLVASEEFRVLHRFRGAQLRHKANGVFLCKSKDSGEFSKGVKLLTDKLEVVARLMHQGNAWGRVVKAFSDTQRKAIEFVLSDEDLIKGFEASLFKAGVDFPLGAIVLGPRGTGSVLREYVAAQKARKVIELRDLSGWVPNRDAYLLGTELLAGTSDLMPDNSDKYRSKFQENSTLKQHGTIEEWKDNVAEVCLKNPVWVTSILTAFAAPLLSLLGMQSESGGFHFFGHSSTGKTIALRLASGVYGQPLIPWRITANALEAQAQLHNDRVLVLDEVGQANPRDVMEAAYMLANSQGKGRLTKEIELRESHHWSLLFLSSGEISIDDLARRAKTGVFEGQRLRFLSTPMIEHQLPVAEIHAFDKSIQCLHGTIGRAWLNVLLNASTSDIEDWKSEFVKHVSFFSKRSKDARIRRVDRRFGLLSLAAKIAQRNKLLPDSWFEYKDDSRSTPVVRKSLVAVKRAWLDGAEVDEEQGTLSDTKPAARRLMEAVSTSIGSGKILGFSEKEDGRTFDVEARGAVHGYVDQSITGSETLFLLPDFFKRHCTPPGEREFCRELWEEDILYRAQPGRNRIRMRTVKGENLSVNSQVQCYQLDLAKLEAFTNNELTQTSEQQELFRKG
ncbi:MAG: hypothetical protein CL524_11670 [Aequorivita sp.]|nr:hypothetical protein [Aequorivita sp.]